MHVMRSSMITRNCVTISFGSEMHAVAERLLACGCYGIFARVVRAAMRTFNERELQFIEYDNRVRLGKSA